MNIEEKVNAIIGYLLAETAEEKEDAISNLRNENTKNKTVNDAEKEISSILCEIGMPEHIKGHRYCTSAIKAAVENPDIIDAITVELYPSVAKKFNTTGSRVERGIRFGIELAWDRCDPNVIERYFGSTISAKRGKPTNSEFIARIANIVRGWVDNA